MTTSLTVTSRFSSAHFYAQPAWDAERNAREFGRCYTPHGHGHNYRVEATYEQPEAPLASLAENLNAVTRILDHEHLNFVIPEFKTTIPTTENIALYLWKKLLEKNPISRLVHLRLYEMDDLWVEVTA